MREFYLFDIPMYLCSEEQHYDKVEKKLESVLKWVYDRHKIPRDPSSSTYSRLRDHIQNKCGPWNFNQAIGWLRLFADGDEIGGHMWVAEGQRIGMNTRRQFALTTYSNILVTEIKHGATSAQIYEGTLEAVRHIWKRDYKRRHFDLDTFERVGPFMDWAGLLKEAKRLHREEYDARRKAAGGPSDQEWLRMSEEGLVK